MLDAGRRSMTVHRPLLATLALTLVAALTASTPAHAQTGGPIAGQNVNMVAGTEWPGGDPFLQRDNEPSISASSLSLERLLAASNSYRTVDIPFAPGGESETGDAWLGLYKSFNAGRTFETYLLPGYPQDDTIDGLRSPLRQRGLRAAADPTVRAGTNGLFVLSGIAFNRTSDEGVIFLARFIDLGVKENGRATEGRDTIPYVDTAIVDTGNSGNFLDKPWTAIDIPRSFASGTCDIQLPADHPVFPGARRTFTTGPIYLAYSRFTGNQDPALGNNRSTKLMITRSLDCGKTWSTPTKISEGNSVNQGANIAIDPATGTVYVAFRRFSTSSQTDAIFVARSVDGQTFPPAQVREVATILPFDQGTTGTSFRTNALPTIAVSVAGGSSNVHVAWSQRLAPGGDARVVVSSSSTAGTSWSTPAPVDPGPATDDFGEPYRTNDGETLQRGHQIMPQLTFSAGKLMLLYYDMRLSHTAGVARPVNEYPFEADEVGRLYDETREKKGELAVAGSTPDAVHKSFIDDAPFTLRRHTIDVRVAQADAGPSPVWVSAPVSRYPFGTLEGAVGGEALKQLQVNPPNLPLFQQGTVPFLGDYVDITGEPFYAEASRAGLPSWCFEQWCYRVEPKNAPVFFATWTSNQDVRPPPPPDYDWTRYRPVPFPPCTEAEGPGCQRPSLSDPSRLTEPCDPGYEGMRNQNVYMSRITQGLLVSSPQPSKPLSSTTERAFVVIAENATPKKRFFRLAIANQPPDAPTGRASFLASNAAPPLRPCLEGQLNLCTAIDVTIPARGSVARSVFVTSATASARVIVDVDEINGLGGQIVGTAAGGLSGYVLLNAVPVSDIVKADGASTDSDLAEDYAPAISFVNVSNPNVSNVNVSNVDPAVNVSNVNVSNVNVSNINVSNPDIADINVSNINVSNVNVSNVNVSNVNVSNVNVSNEPVSEATYTIENTGNTTHSYHVKLVGEAPATGTNLQVILSKPYFTPVSTSCVIGVESRPSVVTSVAPEVVAPAQINDPNIPDSAEANATIALAPGEKAIISVRGNLAIPDLTDVVSRLVPAVVAHGAVGQNGVAAPLLIESASGPATAATVGVLFSLKLESVGGTGTIEWSAPPGALPPGTALNGNEIRGVPTTAGTFVATITATDSSTPQQTASRELTFTVAARASAVTFTLDPTVVPAGVASTARLIVADAEPRGTPSSPTGSVVVTGTPALGFSAQPCSLTPLTTTSSSCEFTVSATTPGVYRVTAAFESTVHAAISSEATLTVGKAETETLIESDTPDPSTPGQAVTVSVAVTAANPVVGTPTGTVTVSDGAGATCSITLPAGSCSLTSTTVGVREWTASYPGDTRFAPSSDTEAHEVKAAVAAYAFTGFLSPLKTAAAYPKASLSGSWTFSRVLPIKWQLEDASGNAVTSADAVASLIALYSGASCTTAPVGPLPAPPYVTTSDLAVLYTPTQGAAGGSDFRPGTTYNFNWDATKNARKGCWSLVLELADGKRWATKVQLK
jgi:hypothetical protein